MNTIGQDSLKTRRTLTRGRQVLTTISPSEAAAKTLGDIARLPVSLKVLLENVLRFEDGSRLHGGRRARHRGLAARPRLNARRCRSGRRAS